VRGGGDFHPSLCPARAWQLVKNWATGSYICKTEQRNLTVELIEIGQRKEGYGGFIGSYLIRGRLNFLVDVGPAASVDSLLDSILERGVRKLDYVLLTHIHLDHAGGLGAIAQAYPEARVIAHDGALPHLSNPDALWHGSLKVLGGVALYYGEPSPVDEKILISHNDAYIEGLDIIETPGHAPHHLSFSYDGYLFAGEACGNYFPEESDYMRPATPPPFFLDAYLSSMDKLLSLPDMKMCFAHLAMMPGSHAFLGRARDQIVLWRDSVLNLLSRFPELTVEECMEELLCLDCNLAGFKGMKRPARDRERFFMGNSIKGLIGFLKR